MNEIEIIQESGFSEVESRVYLNLIENGSSLAGQIIKQTGFHKATIYQILQRLKEKGIVSSIIKGKKQYFEAITPKRLLNILKEKEENLKKMLPILEEKIKKDKEKQEITVYSGIKGIRYVLDKMLEELNPKGEYFDFGVSGLFRKVMKEYWDIFQIKKKKYKIKSKIIFNSEVKIKDKNLIKNYYGEYKFHSKGHSSATDTIIYKNTIILFIWTANPPIAILIKNKENAESYKNHFNLMWKIAKEGNQISNKNPFNSKKFTPKTFLN